MFACSPHEDPIKDEADLKARYSELVGVDPTLQAPTLTPAQQAAQDINDRREYIAMLDDVIPMQRAELMSALYIRAEMAKAGDVAIHKARALKAIAKTTGALSPFMERALLLIRAGKK